MRSEKKLSNLWMDANSKEANLLAEIN